MELLAIERDLSGPDRQAALMRYDAVLCQLAARLQTALNRGLEPDLFEKCLPLQEAVTVARKLLRLQVRKADEAEKGQ